MARFYSGNPLFTLRIRLFSAVGFGFAAVMRGNVAQPLVALQGIVKRFGAFAANDGASLSIGEGELHALLGENGAGKSTLVKILFGLLQPDSGSIRWKGEEVRIADPSAARQLGVAMVFQHFSSFENLTALENVALGLPGRTADRSLADETAALASRYGLPVQLDAPSGACPPESGSGSRSCGLCCNRRNS